LVLAGRLDVDWDHLLGRRHEVTREEIEAALLDGPYDFHEDIANRFVATGALEGTFFRLLVLFEIRLDVEGAYVWVPNAFWTPPDGRRGGGSHAR